MKSLNYALILMLVVLVKCSHKNRPVFTFVTALIDLQKNKTDPTRTFDKYLEFLSVLIKTPSNMIIFGEPKIRAFVQARRSRNNTVFIQISKSRLSESWQMYLLDRTVALKSLNRKILQYFYGHYRIYTKIPTYFVISLMKIPFVHQAMKVDPFHSDYYQWIDAGINHMIKFGFSPQSNYEDFQLFSQQPFQFHTYIWEAQNGYYSYGHQQDLRYVKDKIKTKDYVLGGYFGGRAEAWPTLLKVYQNFLRVILENGELTFDQQVFGIMSYRYPYLLTTVTRMGGQDYTIELNARIQMQTQQQRRWSFVQSQHNPQQILTNQFQWQNSQNQFRKQNQYQFLKSKFQQKRPTEKELEKQSQMIVFARKQQLRTFWFFIFNLVMYFLTVWTIKQLKNQNQMKVKNSQEQEKQDDQRQTLKQ